MAAAASLVLPLWLGACVAPATPESTPATSAPLAISKGTSAPAPPPFTPAPQPQNPFPTEAAAPPARSLDQASAGLSAGTGGPGFSATTTPPPSTSAPGNPGPSSPAGPDPGEAAALRASVGPGPTSSAAGPRAVTAYFVLLDDGGRKGVRFGCNDSLVGVSHETPVGGQALPAAIGALLDTPGVTAAGVREPDLYNALAGSQLLFLSGSFDGTTVTVYLAGTLRPGGACDLPRLEAQLTQTAVAAVGAIRAEVYVNGVPLDEALKLN